MAAIVKLKIAETEKEELKKIKSYQINDLIRKFQYIKRNDTLQNEELVELRALEEKHFKDLNDASLKITSEKRKID